MKIDAALLRASWHSWVVLDIARVGPYWLQLAWTFLFSAALALAFTVVGLIGWSREFDLGRVLWLFSRNLIVSLTIGCLIHALFEIGGRLLGGPARLRRLTKPQRLLFYAGIPSFGGAAGWPLGFWLAGGGQMASFGTPAGLRAIVLGIALALLITAALVPWFEAKGRAIEAEREATEAQLRLLQAQIEPHFLFNTLANVLSLIDHDAAKAKRTLGAFTDYLRAGLIGLRRTQGPLADELALAEAYLRVQQARMEERLTFHIEADAAAARTELPPLLLQPLVENAVHHGLEPKLDGGRVVISARAEGGQLVIEVRDDGLGMGASPRNGAGVALANVRDRLRARYGDAASLELSAAGPGTLARLTLPLEMASAGPV